MVFFCKCFYLKYLFVDVEAELVYKRLVVGIMIRRESIGELQVALTQRNGLYMFPMSGVGRSSFLDTVGSMAKNVSSVWHNMGVANIASPEVSLKIFATSSLTWNDSVKWVNAEQATKFEEDIVVKVQTEVFNKLEGFLRGIFNNKF